MNPTTSEHAEISAAERYARTVMNGDLRPIAESLHPHLCTMLGTIIALAYVEGANAVLRELTERNAAALKDL